MCDFHFNKIALCFLISYDHEIHKEHIWKQWIEPNKDIINVYFHYTDYNKIKSLWILDNVIPSNYIRKTTYYDVVSAYLSIMNYACNDDAFNKWFCILTDACCPIISPAHFRYLFNSYNNKSIIKYRDAWWNVNVHRRANLKLIDPIYHLANSPWFILTKQDVCDCLSVSTNNKYAKLLSCVNSGGLANESIFAIMLKIANNMSNTINEDTHITDWTRMSSSTSPYVFNLYNSTDKKIIETALTSPFIMFIRKVSPTFSDDTLKYYIYSYSHINNNKSISIFTQWYEYLFGRVQ